MPYWALDLQIYSNQGKHLSNCRNKVPYLPLQAIPSSWEEGKVRWRGRERGRMCEEGERGAHINAFSSSFHVPLLFLYIKGSIPSLFCSFPYPVLFLFLFLFCSCSMFCSFSFSNIFFCSFSVFFSFLFLLFLFISQVCFSSFPCFVPVPFPNLFLFLSLISSCSFL